MLSQKEQTQLEKYCKDDPLLCVLIQHLLEDHRMELSRISHEIRNPVTLINSFLQLTQAHHPEVTAFHTWAPLLENMEFLKQLLEELSDYNNSRRLHKEMVSLSRFLASLADTCQPSLLPVQIAYEKLSPIPPASFDKLRLQAALLNLIRNAGEALSGNPNGRITLRLSFDGDFFHLDVANNGPQIPPEHMDHLFDPFITHKKDGTGLGLSIVKNIAQAHGGTVCVSSDESETCFTLRLPLLYA